MKNHFCSNVSNRPLPAQSPTPVFLAGVQTTCGTIVLLLEDSQAKHPTIRGPEGSEVDHMAAGVVDPLSPSPGGHAESLEMQRSVSEHADGCLEIPDIGPTAGFTYPTVKNSIRLVPDFKPDRQGLKIPGQTMRPVPESEESHGDEEPRPRGSMRPDPGRTAAQSL